MFSGLQLRLTLLFLGTGVVVLTVLGGAMYALVAGYVRTTTDAALDVRMAFEFQQLGAPLPSALAAAAQALAVPAGQTLSSVDRAELAAVYVLPLDGAGAVLFNPNTLVVPHPPDPDAVQAALASGADRRTVVDGDGSRIRLLTYRLTREDGPVLVQAGRSLAGQDDVLHRLLLGLAALACVSLVVLGWGSWWLAGRSLQPAAQAWARQQTFIANASHEIRAPLTLLRASAEVAQRTSAPDAVQHELLADVIHEADHITRLVEDLLLLSRLDARQLPVARAAVDVAPLLADLERQMGRVAAARGIALVVTQATGTVLADRALLRQVLVILVDNALRYTAPGGTVWLEAAAQAHAVELRVRDSGAGIPAEHLPHLFERFYRVDTARSDAHRGSGLGLSIAQALMHAQDGQIRLASAVNVGTTVTIRLPAA